MSVAPPTRLSIQATLSWLWPFWVQMPGRLLFLLLLTPLVVAFDVYIPMVIANIFDELKQGQITASFIQDKALQILALGIVHFVLYSIVQSVRGLTNFRFENNFRVRLGGAIIRLGQRFFFRFRTGDVTTRLIDDVSENKLGWFACSGIFRLYEAFITLAGCLFFMFQLHTPLTLMTCLPLVCVAIFYIRTSTRTTAYSQRNQQAISELNSFLTSTLESIRVVKAYRQEQRQIEAFATVVENQRSKEIELVKVSALLQISYSRFSEVIILGIFLLGGWLVIHGQMTIGALIAFNTYIFKLIWPMVDIGQFFIKGRAAGVSVARVKELEDFPPDIHNTAKPKPWPQTRWELSFHQVNYTFANGTGLHNLTMSLYQGETVAIAGAIGSGKSLCLNLLPRMIEPQTGEILLNDAPLSAYDVHELRRHIGFASQVASLFSESIRDNIRFGRSSISDEDLNQAIRVAQLEQDLPLFPEGIDTLVGQRGVKLSGGQKQRIAIARAIVTRPPILILDDCTSALDAETEARLWKALYQFVPDLLVVVVTHRVSTLQRMDRIFFLQDGYLVASGTDQELRQTNPAYALLYQSEILA